MKCLILAAGQGSRLRPVAEVKPLASLFGVPLIEHVMRLARAGGATEFVVVTGYKAERLGGFLPGASERVGAPVTIAHNADWRSANGSSVIAAADHLGDRFIILMSDHLFDPAILAALIGGARAEDALTLAVDRNLGNPLLDMEDATKVRTDEEGRILAIGKQIEDFDCVDTGIFVATPHLIDALRSAKAAGGAGSLSEGVQSLADRKLARTFDCGGRWWHDVDTETSLRQAEEHFPASLAALPARQG